MSSLRHKGFVIILFFITVFGYLFIFNRFHLLYLEQIQLFRFKYDYFADYLSRPGGFSEYIGALLTQFFLIEPLGPIIVTLIGIAIYFITSFILRLFNVSGILWPLILVIFHTGLCGDQFYRTGYSIGLLVSLLSCAGCLLVQNAKMRHTIGFTGFFLLYPVAGLFSFIFPILLILRELYYSKSKYRYLIISGYLLSIMLVPYLFWRYIFLLPFHNAWLSPVPAFGYIYTRINMAIFVGLIPFILIINGIFISVKKQVGIFRWNLPNVIGGVIIIAGLSGYIKIYCSDHNTELILQLDHNIQKSNWDKALELCLTYPEQNQIVVYFTNLALLNSGRLGDNMFNYSQIGPEGLSLAWANNSLIPFFGCEIYYHLGHINEAYRWAYEAMEVNGQCPRLLKRLVMTSLINNDIKIAEKYLNQLHQTLYYKKWAELYMKMVKNPGLMALDPEISGKRRFSVKNDFFVDSKLGLTELLGDHPNNKAVFEYYMASLLLKKELVPFIEGVSRLQGFGYKKIPVHFEEVILWYIGYSKQNVIPQGYNIRKSTLDRFKNYFYHYSKESNPDLISQTLQKEFGDTFWYYYHFIKPPNTQ